MKTSLIDPLKETRDHLVPRWDDARHAHVLAGMEARRRRNRRRRIGAVGLAGAAVAIALTLTFRPATSVEPFADSHIVRVERSYNREVFRVEHGGAWFEVTPGAKREVRVDALDVTVQVRGTRFLVQKEGLSVHVAVEHGVVWATWKGALQVMHAGDSLWFPPKPQSAAHAPVGSSSDNDATVNPRSLEDAPAAAPGENSGVLLNPLGSATSFPSERTDDTSIKSQKTRTKAPKWANKRFGKTSSMKNLDSNASWKALAMAGEYQRAWNTMRTGPPPKDEPAELLLSADVARLSGHPEEALDLLRRVADLHSNDPRAPLAAFTLGGILLNDLGRPKEAADAFEQARTLAPHAPLAEDALAREVEALSRIQSPKARSLAETFERTYPKSLRRRAVRQFGGLQ